MPGGKAQGDRQPGGQSDGRDSAPQPEALDQPEVGDSGKADLGDADQGVEPGQLSHAYNQAPGRDQQGRQPTARINQQSPPSHAVAGNAFSPTDPTQQDPEIERRQRRLSNRAGQ